VPLERFPATSITTTQQQRHYPEHCCTNSIGDGVVREVMVGGTPVPPLAPPRPSPPPLPIMNLSFNTPYFIILLVAPNPLPVLSAVRHR